ALRRDPRVPPALADVAACLLARDPAARPATADEAAALLDAHRTSPGAAAEVGATDLATYLENPAAYRAARPPALYSVETAEAASLPAEAAGDRPAAGRVHPLRKTRILFAAVGVLALASVAYAAWVRRPTPAATVRPESASAGGIVPPTRTAPALVADSVALTVPPVVPGPDSVARPLVPPGTEAVAPLPTPPDRVEPLRADPPATAADVPVAPPAAGALSVAVQPWAEVVVDGRSIGTTPLNGPISLPAGTHRVVLRNGAFPEYAETVTVAPGETARLAVSLWSTVGRVTLTVSPWARVEVDGRAVGTTPLREPLVLAPGTHTVRLTHPTLGVHEETVRVGAGEARDLRVRMGAGGGGAGAGSAADGGGGGGPLEQPLH
ncbi:MAG TPA: PEGA domain-containing protein, partial [Rhodothermales bacterium]|nr:PEGA domain-containing protein [Rhodothermales bacterium]